MHELFQRNQVGFFQRNLSTKGECVTQWQDQSQVSDSDRTTKSAKSAHWAVFISGRGSNLQALLDAVPKIQISLVVSSNVDAIGVERAHRAGVSVLILPKNISWGELSEELKLHKVDRIFLAGFMKVIPESFIGAWPKKILNLHPSLLPSYKGLRAIERGYADGAALGVTIHWVTPELDAGPVFLQREVYPAGTAGAHSLIEVEEQIHRVENELVVEAVRRCEGC
jgi:phosphoribosylglycinamide formyltransferase-1